MKITNLSVKNFRSIASVDFHPRSFNVFVGPNNSGKSNISDALEFLGDCHRTDPSYAIDLRGGFDRVVYRTGSIAPRRSISFNVVTEIGEDDARRSSRSSERDRAANKQPAETSSKNNRTFRVGHRFTISPVRESGGPIQESKSAPPVASSIEISREELEISLLDNGEVISTLEIRRLKTLTTRIRGTREILTHCRGPLAEDTERFLRRYLTAAADIKTELLFDKISFWIPGGIQMASMLSTIRAYQPQTSACRESSSPKTHSLLGKNGEDLPATIETLRKILPSQLKKIEDHMRTLIPNLASIEVRVTDELQWVLEFKEEGPLRTWRSSEVSDGTMRSLALFSAIYQPSGNVSIIEEPENTLHPWVIREFVEACRSFSENRTVILSSHSPALVNTLEPEDIWLVWKEGGKTEIRNLEYLVPDLRNDWESGKLTLFDFLDSGYLPESVPGGVQ